MEDVDPGVERRPYRGAVEDGRITLYSRQAAGPMFAICPTASVGAPSSARIELRF